MTPEQMAELNQSLESFNQQTRSYQYTAPQYQYVAPQIQPYEQNRSNQIIYNRIGNSVIGTDGTRCTLIGERAICR